MTRIIRIAGCALALAFFSLAAFTAAHAQTERYNYGYCVGAATSGGRHVQIVTRAFVIGPAGIPGSGRDAGLGNAVYKTYGPLRENGCIMSLTAAEAEVKQRELVDQVSKNLGPDSVVVVNWIPEGTTALSAAVPEKAPTPAPAAPALVAAAAPAAPAPVKAPTAAANAAVTPKPAPVAVAAKPASPAPAKPATVAAKPAVYVICKADWNPDLRRFYNPPVDGRGAGYPEWQASWQKYLVAHYKFRESNFGCTKYPTREEAQAGFEEWVVNARQTPTMNGLPSPVIITNWKY